MRIHWSAYDHQNSKRHCGAYHCIKSYKTNEPNIRNVYKQVSPSYKSKNTSHLLVGKYDTYHKRWVLKKKALAKYIIVWVEGMDQERPWLKKVWEDGNGRK